jgi:hypothetical protein
MSVAVNTLARTTVLDAVGDTAGSSSVLRPATIDNTAIEGMLRRRRRWRIPASIVDDSPPLVIEPQTIPSAWDVKVRRVAPPAICFSASLAVHLILLLAAALIAAGINSPVTTVLSVEGGLLDTDQEELVTLAAPLTEATSAVQDDASLAAFTAVELDPGVMQVGEPAVALVDISDREVVGLLGDIAGLADGAGDGLSTGGDGAGSDGEGDSAGDDGTEFFGVQGQGNKFVFVCDCSGSMSGQKWLELQRELSRCIGSLSAGKSFYVIFFDGEMHPMFEPASREPALLDATSENVERARLWIAEKSLGSNTSPCDSMKFAASLEPDAIFLLTDGEFSDYTAPYMRGFNRKRAANGKPKVVVHTIGFFSQKHQLVLERIAKDSGGTYRFVGGPAPPARPKRKSHNVYARPIGPPMFGPALPIGAGAPQGGD